ncbi:putative PHD type zinc finger protein with BAH domain-containing protein [Microsporum ferrugineum]
MATAAADKSPKEPREKDARDKESRDVTESETASNATTPAPYSTRSRNRVGARINYAEDNTELDAELDQPMPPASTNAGSSTRGTPGRKPRDRDAAAQTTSGNISSSNSNNHNSSSSSSNSNEKPPGMSTRRAAAAAAVNGAAAKDGKDGKDTAIPGTSSFSANPNSVVVSKKRKQPGASTTVQNVVPANGGGQAGKRFIAAGSRNSEESATTSMMTFRHSKAMLKNGKLKADDGTLLAPNDHVYLICEPPGEPYYLARIMEFLPPKDNPSGPIESVRVNWYYRPRDIQRKTNDLRVVFASMHSDACPLTSLRGKCTIRHKTEIANWDQYMRAKDCFWFERMYDRYIHRYYDVIPTSRVINVPQHVKEVLDERWKYVLVEIGRRKELTSAVKTCKKCSQYAANNDSVDCAVCHNTYHMLCVRPVLQKKPARGFAWACGPCSRAQEKKLEARNTPMMGESRAADNEPEVVEEEEEEHPPAETTATTQRSSPSNVERPPIKPATAEQISQAKLWQFRYLGIHCRVEDALDYDDRIYPRASSRLGTRHQANVVPWYGHPVEYFKPVETKRKYVRSGPKKDVKMSKEALAAQEADRAERASRPKWMQEVPPGYIPRGDDEAITVDGKKFHTAELQFKMPSASQLPARGEDDTPGSHLSVEDREKFIDEYMAKAKEIAVTKGIPEYSTNYLDKALALLYEENFDVEPALVRLRAVHKYNDLKEPHLKPEEIKLFEAGVAKYGSELRSITKHVGTVKHRHIVRFYYMWKKTPKGRQIWGNYEDRKGKKLAKKADSAAKLLDDVADDYDDSAFDNDKAMEKRRGFTCKFCNTRSSKRWRRAPAVPPGFTVPAEQSGKREKGNRLTVSLCQRCAVLWRKYGIHWEDPDEIAKRISQGGNKSWRRKYDEGLLSQLLTTSESDVRINQTTATIATSIGVHVTTEVVKEPVNSNPPEQPPQPPAARKKTKTADKEANAAKDNTVMADAPPPPKKKTVEKAVQEAPPPLVPEPPRPKVLPCAVCKKMDPMGDQHLSCRDCRLTVHRGCYGVDSSRSAAKWLCDMCSNDRNPTVSTSYECVLCPVTETEHELMEPPKTSHKKKSEREREKERLEREMVNEAIKLYRQRQEVAGKPIGPREPLKRTAGNNWVHVICAVWLPEIKFGNAKDLEPAEGIESIPQESFKDRCKICKTDNGACVSCRASTCNARFHVGCAHQANYTMGFDVTPIKSSRKDVVTTATIGEETGVVAPAIWCPHHSVTTIVHDIGELTGSTDVNALQIYARTFKQADLTLTGTARKAAYVQQSATPTGPGKRATTNGIAPTSKDEANGDQAAATNDKEEASKKCFRCQAVASPKWWRRGQQQMANGLGGPLDLIRRPGSMHHSSDIGMGMNGDMSERAVYECHKCHLKKHHTPPALTPALAPLPPAPYGPDRDREVGPTRLPEFHRNGYASSPHAQPVQQPHGVVGGPVPPLAPLSHPHGAPEWRPEYDQRPTEYGNPLHRKGISPAPNGVQLGPPPPFHQGPHHPHPPPPPPGRMNGYPPSLPHPHQHQQHPPPFTNGGPPPPSLPPPHQPYPHQNQYGPIAPHPPNQANPSPHPGHAYSGPSTPAPGPGPGARLYFSPPPSRTSLPGPSHPPRMFPVDRPVQPNLPSPSAARRSLDPQRPPNIPEHIPQGQGDNAATAPPRPRSESMGRQGSHGGLPPPPSVSAPGTSGSAASASPSLKNLLL